MSVLDGGPDPGYVGYSKEVSVIGSLRVTLLLAVFAIALTPASLARASCIDPTDCLCAYGYGDIAILAVTVVAEENGVTEVRVDDVRSFPEQTTTVTAGDVREVAPVEVTVGGRYLAVLLDCQSCDECQDSTCHDCELCENGTDRLRIWRPIGTDGISCTYDDETVWIPLPTALDLSVSPSCSAQVSARLEEEGADLDCNDNGLFLCGVGAAGGDGWQGVGLVALVTAGLFRRRVARRAL